VWWLFATHQAIDGEKKIRGDEQKGRPLSVVQGRTTSEGSFNKGICRRERHLPEMRSKP